MNFEMNEDQRALADAVGQLVQRHAKPPQEENVSAAVHHHYSAALDDDLTRAGYFDTAREQLYGPLGAALVIEAVAKIAPVVEVATSAIVAPMLLDGLPRPIAVARYSDLAAPIRFLDRAKSLLVDFGDEAGVIEIATGCAESAPSIFAYPYGRIRSPLDLSSARRLGKGSGARLRSWWRVALAVEASAVMLQAIDFTVEYVKNRRQFGRPIGSYQAVQHRLASDAQLAEGSRWLARRAAWSGSERDAAIAALNAQESIATVVYDCHQFNGALGLTLEHSLHFWTFRLRALQGELGGVAGQAAAVAELNWS